LLPILALPLIIISFIYVINAQKLPRKKGNSIAIAACFPIMHHDFYWNHRRPIYNASWLVGTAKTAG
jgi:hypothetical protein